MNNKKIAKLNLPDGKVIELPVMSGSLGPDVIDITSLYKQADMFTFDPGFTSTGSCKSDITFIDGDQGILLHRGYKIEDLAEKSSFLETSYLLMYGEMPSKEKKLEFVNSITMHTMLNEQISNFYRGFKIMLILWLYYVVLLGQWLPFTMIVQILIMPMKER